MNRTTQPTVEWLAIDRIKVINPRSRGKPKFAQIVDTIAELGLKKPIIVARRQGKDGETRYDLVCGQGRLEAFKKLGEPQVPAIIIDASKEDLLLMSLAENLARRHFTTIDMAKEIVSLKERGYSNAVIAKKTGLNASYVGGIIKLYRQGEERLIFAVEHELIPLSVAIEIANSDDEQTQQALAEAYESGQLRGKSIIRARRLVEKRRTAGKRLRSGVRIRGNTKALSSQKIMDEYRQEAAKQRLLVQKGKLSETRLLFIVSALKQLFTQEAFVQLLQAEGLYTLPQYLADRIHGKAGHL